METKANIDARRQAFHDRPFRVVVNTLLKNPPLDAGTGT